MLAGSLGGGGDISQDDHISPGQRLGLGSCPGRKGKASALKGSPQECPGQATITSPEGTREQTEGARKTGRLVGNVQKPFLSLLEMMATVGNIYVCTHTDQDGKGHRRLWEHAFSLV